MFGQMFGSYRQANYPSACEYFNKLGWLNRFVHEPIPYFRHQPCFPAGVTKWTTLRNGSNIDNLWPRRKFADK